jgi:uncharacterized protein (TIGR00730 family)
VLLIPAGVAFTPPASVRGRFPRERCNGGGPVLPSGPGGRAASRRALDPAPRPAPAARVHGAATIVLVSSRSPGRTFLPTVGAIHKMDERKAPLEAADLLAEAKAVLDNTNADLDGEILRDLLVYVLKLRQDGLDTLDLKILTRSFKELRYAFRIFQPYRDRRKVTIFGSARVPPEDPHYRLTVETARGLAAAGFMVITGAAGGIMEAGNEGAGRDNSFGLHIRLPFEPGSNPHIAGDPKLISFHYFFTRKLLFVKASDGLILLPGGFGTLDEGFETLTLLQTGKSEPRPVVLLDLPGSTYWQRWESFVRDEMLERGLISTQDFALFRRVESAGAAVDEIRRFYSNYHSSRYVGSRFVVRMKRALSGEARGQLSADFADILTGGGFEQRGRLDDEEDEPETEGLVRLVFAYNRSSAGRLRQLIDRVNEA